MGIPSLGMMVATIRQHQGREVARDLEVAGEPEWEAQKHPEEEEEEEEVQRLRELERDATLSVTQHWRREKQQGSHWVELFYTSLLGT